MEHNNILDNEGGRSFYYGNRTLVCLLGCLLFLGISTLVLDYVEGNSLSRNLEFILIVVPLIMQHHLHLELSRKQPKRLG